MKSRRRGYCLAAGLLVLAWLAAPAVRAEKACPGFGGDAAFDALVKKLSAATSCETAAATLHDCAWGSSADTSFGPIVVATCEKRFLPRLTHGQLVNYGRRMQLCAYRYARQDGTLWMSVAALCQVDVAMRFAGHIEAADTPVQSSFDCKKARTPLERAICSDDGLGQADVILAQAYKETTARTVAERAELAKNERFWLASLPARCRLADAGAPSKTAIACLRTSFEKRFTALDMCSAGEGLDDACLNGGDEGKEDDPAPARASFDCTAPSSALEIAICADQALGNADIALAAAYRGASAAIGAAHHADLVASQRDWLRFVPRACPLGAIGGIPPVAARACARSAFETRTAQLAACASTHAVEPAPCLGDFKVSPAKADVRK